MRSIDELLPDIQIAAPGVARPVAMNAVTRALAEFLSKSEVWREWSYDTDPDDITNGLYEWAKPIIPTDPDILDYQWMRVKRVDIISWPDGCELQYRTTRWLNERDREWRTRTGTPQIFTQEGDGGGAVRFVPAPPAAATYTANMNARLVIVTNVTTGLGPDSALAGQTPALPERIFENYREIIVAGALAILYAIPGKAWSNNAQVAFQRGMFEDGIIRAQSAAAVDFGHPGIAVEYGGYP